MAVKASSNITLYHVIDVASVTIYYLLQSSTANPPAKPTTDNPGGNWTTTEPTYTEGSTNTLYTVTKTKFSDGTFEYTPVSKSSSYEAAKNAYNKALNAESVANAAEKKVYHTCSSSGGTAGYFYFARCVIVGNYCNKPISFTITNRGIDQTDVELRFANNSGLDPAVSILKKNGKANIYIVKADTSTWDLYVQKTESYDNATFTRFNMNGYDNKFTWTWQDQTVTSLPSNYITAVGTGEIIVGTQTGVTGSWTGVANFDVLKDGQEITYWLPYNGSGNATLNLTLSGGNTTGAKNVYYSGTNRCTTHYGAGNIIRMIYRENVQIAGSGSYTGWWCDANYDSNNTDRLRFQNNIKTNKQYISSSRLLVSDSQGYFPLRNGVTFDRDKAILWAGSNLNPWINTNSNNNFISYANVDLCMNGYWYWNTSSTSTNKWTGATKFGLIDAEIADGNKIYSGDKITGNSTTATIFSNSGISNAIVNDYYINTSTGYYYKCTVAGGPSVAKWVYEGDSTIPGGKRIYWGNHLTHIKDEDDPDDTGEKTTATLISSSYIGDRYINFNTGRLYECTLAGASGTAKWQDKGMLIDINKTVYLKCELHEHSVIVDDVPFTTEIPKEDDGKIYIAIGLSYSHYQCGLFPEHPMFMFKEGFFKSLEQITYDSLVLAKQVSSEVNTVKSNFQKFLEGDKTLGDEGYLKFKSDVQTSINKIPGQIELNFDDYFTKSNAGKDMATALDVVKKVNSYIKFATTDSATPYIELGRQPDPDNNLPNTYRLRIENNEIYMVYGDGDTESLTKLTRWFTENGNSSLVVNSLLTQQEMAINPFKFIKNSDGSLSFRKVE